MITTQAIRPDIHTKFHIDMNWWERMGRDFHLYLRSNLCAECQIEAGANENRRTLDWVDQETGEVRRVDALWGRLITCCSRKPEWITPNTPLMTAIFRALLAGGNASLSPTEIYERIGKSNPPTILRILTSGQSQYGIVPDLRP